MKLTPSGSATIFGTYFGGGAADSGNGLAVANDGSIYLAGGTFSPDLPIISGVQSSYGANGDAFLAKWTGAGLPYVSLSSLELNFGNQMNCV